MKSQRMLSQDSFHVAVGRVAASHVAEVAIFPITSFVVDAACRARRASLARVLFALVFVLMITTAAMADTVSGRVYGVDGKPVANGSFTAKPAKGDAVQFKTDAAGSFSTYLDAGRYVVTVNGSADTQGTIDSYPQPVQTDIHLKKEGK